MVLLELMDRDVWATRDVNRGVFRYRVLDSYMSRSSLP